MQPHEEVLAAYKPFLTGAIKDISETRTIFPKFEASLIQKLVENSISLMTKVPTLAKVSSQAVIIGDLHGSITDLINLFSKFLENENTNYVFLGDYVDRGLHSIPVITLLLAFFNKYPDKITLIRGNHEFSHINQLYGFYDEILSVYEDESLWDSFQIFFAWLPLAAIIDSSVFCVHGGLSPLLSNANQIDEIRRPIYDYDNQPMIADLVWSDPNDTVQTYVESHRGSGVLFGTDALRSFLIRSNLKLLVRAHQCVADGFSLFSSSMGVTVFSCSDYCRLIHNKCGSIKYCQQDQIELYSFSSEQNFLSQQAIATMAFNSENPGIRRSIRKIEVKVTPPKSGPGSGVVSPKQPPRRRTRRVTKRRARKANPGPLAAVPAAPPAAPPVSPGPGVIGINGINKVSNVKVRTTPKRRITTPRLSPRVPINCPRPLKL